MSRLSFMARSAFSRRPVSSPLPASMCEDRSPEATVSARSTALFSGPVMERVMNHATPMPMAMPAVPSASSRICELR
ncbi:hypothetical protein D3C86_2043200 [compost metagenome]